MLALVAVCGAAVASAAGHGPGTETTSTFCSPGERWRSPNNPHAASTLCVPRGQARARARPFPERAAAGAGTASWPQPQDRSTRFSLLASDRGAWVPVGASARRARRRGQSHGPWAAHFGWACLRPQGRLASRPNCGLARCVHGCSLVAALVRFPGWRQGLSSM